MLVLFNEASHSVSSIVTDLHTFYFDFFYCISHQHGFVSWGTAQLQYTMALLEVETANRHGTRIVHSIKDGVLVKFRLVDFGLGIERPKILINSCDLMQGDPNILCDFFGCYVYIGSDSYISRDGYGEFIDIYASSGHELMEGLG